LGSQRRRDRKERREHYGHGGGGAQKVSAICGCCPRLSPLPCRVCSFPAPTHRSSRQDHVLLLPLLPRGELRHRRQPDMHAQQHRSQRLHRRDPRQRRRRRRPHSSYQEHRSGPVQAAGDRVAGELQHQLHRPHGDIGQRNGVRRRHVLRDDQRQAAEPAREQRRLPGSLRPVHPSKGGCNDPRIRYSKPSKYMIFRLSPMDPKTRKG
ncbi:hypothetical protein Taro_005841, partial [Colocasia esculenta]|nr:hypothetical protein [Colocasia esculenta]